MTAPTDPLHDDPLAYPGGTPTADAVVDDDGDRPIGSGDLDGRVPVLAVGSNADPLRLRAKFARHGVPGPFAMTAAVVADLRPGHSAHVSTPGFVPAAPCASPGTTSTLWVGWFDPAQVEALDRTERNYRRVPLDPAHHPVTLTSGEVLESCAVYESEHGVLLDTDGAVVPLSPQRELLATLLRGVAGLADLVGPTVEDWLAATRASATVRARVQELLRAGGRTGPAGI